MEDINCNEAPVAPAPRQLATLVDGVRSLWSTGLPPTAPGREKLIEQLTNLDLEVERLTIRATAGGDDPDDILARGEELTDLERRWYQAAAATELDAA